MTCAAAARIARQTIENVSQIKNARQEIEEEINKQTNNLYELLLNCRRIERLIQFSLKAI